MAPQQQQQQQQQQQKEEKKKRESDGMVTSWLNSGASGTWKMGNAFEESRNMFWHKG